MLDIADFETFATHHTISLDIIGFLVMIQAPDCPETFYMYVCKQQNKRRASIYEAFIQSNPPLLRVYLLEAHFMHQAPIYER